MDLERLEIMGLPAMSKRCSEGDTPKMWSDASFHMSAYNFGREVAITTFRWYASG